MSMIEYNFKRNKKPLHIYYENNYFSKKEVSAITNLTIGQLGYLNTIRLVSPFISIGRIGAFYTYLQLVELKTIQRFINDYKIPKTRLKIAKDILKEIDSSKDLSDKNIMIAHGELFFINNYDLADKLISLSKDSGQLGFIKYFALSEIETELEKSAKILNMSDYQHKKNSRFDVV